MIIRAIAIALLLLGSGCADPIPLEGRPCPCAAGWTCCQGVCIASSRSCSVPPTTHPDAGVDRPPWADHPLFPDEWSRDERRKSDGPVNDLRPVEGSAGEAPLPDTLPWDNSKCAQAKTLTLAGGTVTVQGSTAGQANEFGSRISCRDVDLQATMVGPQRYYHLTIPSASSPRSYRFRLTPKFNEARLYAFHGVPGHFGCLAFSMRPKCAFLTPPVKQGETVEAYLNIPSSTTSNYLLAVDSTSGSEAGDFTLTVDEDPAPSNQACAAARPISLDQARAGVYGSTRGAANEFGTAVSCGIPLATFVGPQSYFRVSLAAGTTYRVFRVPETETPIYPSSRIYVFRASCTATAIDADCASKGMNGAVEATPYAGLLFTPKTAGDHIIAVDATDSSEAAIFRLFVQEHGPASNGICAAGTPLTLTGGKVEVAGATYGAANEFGKNVLCVGGIAEEGPQLYYSIALASGQTYALSLAAAPLHADLLLFGDTCDAAKISTDCGSNGQSGVFSHSPLGGETQAIVFTPASSGVFRLAVDQSWSSLGTSFKLGVRTVSPPPNSTCAAAQAVSLAGSSTVIEGDTTAAPNEFGTQVSCGGVYPLRGSQLYYRLDLQAGKTYQIVLVSSFMMARVALFGDSCDPALIEKECAGKVEPSWPGAISFTPKTSGYHRLVVDSTGAENAGPFQIHISH